MTKNEAAHLLAELVNSAKMPRMVLHLSGAKPVEHYAALLGDSGVYCDYVDGRGIKVNLRNYAELPALADLCLQPPRRFFTLYDRDNGEGAGLRAAHRAEMAYRVKGAD